MTKSRFTILILLFPIALAAQQTPEQLFDEANRAYQQGNFSEAAARYELIRENGVADATIFYNLGNAYYKSGNISKAILNYERALKLAPNDDDLLHNLQLANLMIVNKIDPAPRLFIWDWWDAVKNTFSLNGITWIVYGLFLLFTGSIILVLLARSFTIRNAGVVAALGSFLLLVVSSMIFAGKLNVVQSSDTAIVTANIATIKNSPDEKSTDAFVLHEGVKVFITDKVNEWLKIRLADGKVGWIDEKAAEII
ncbi:MAG: tetratricopeptide repeat protein [Bacteroidetes bacterium]|nr:tetratricopeptide repeat protein [Bacteroidota bacterium]MCW5895871.1 tetratricopeptide repeat protein [Bacteroidota bacterium]